MRTHANKNQGGKSQSATGSRIRNGKEPAFQHMDNRPEAVSQRKLQEMADNSDRSTLKHTPSSNSNVIQGYFEGKDLQKGNVPSDARLSENLKIVREGKQKLYADPEKIKEANAVLGEGSRIVLKQGDKKDYDLESAMDGKGFHTIGFTDHYQVVPRYNPNVPAEDDLIREQSPEENDTPEETEKKHRGYAHELIQLLTDFGDLLEAIGNKKEGDGLSTWDGGKWFSEVYKWLNENRIRNQVLRLGMQEIAAAFLLDNDRKSRNARVQSLFHAYSQFIDSEIAAKDKIALPTDCAAVVREIVSNGKTVENDRLDDNPDIGSNYYTELPENASNVGWNFHWGGVVLKDGDDNVTLESAGGTSIGSMGKNTWWFQMYGTKNVEQTFKKQVHQTHIDRNRDLVDKGDGKTKGLSHEQLDRHQARIDQWTKLDSDR